METDRQIIKSTKNENYKEMKLNANDEQNDKVKSEIKALWKSQKEKYLELKKELNETMDSKLASTKSNILQVKEENKANITEEIGILKKLQEEATNSIKAQ